jgi:hypothetical protein
MDAMQATVTGVYARSGFAEVIGAAWPSTSALAVLPGRMTRVPASIREDLVGQILGIEANEALPKWAARVDGVERIGDGDAARFSLKPDAPELL